MEHLVQQSGGSPYRVTEEMASAMKALIAENPTDEPGKQTLAMGQGTWEVCYMISPDTSDNTTFRRCHARWQAPFCVRTYSCAHK